ncbi:TraR/DksA C4-type zinc finger protein [Modestobacter sp. NPDC049651]|uniref:TraR/DksA family transcriptional regulator n=1 Tax=unclassified Modestobacter TaxID=2643866 RepID=UPI0033FF4CDC
MTALAGPTTTATARDWAPFRVLLETEREDCLRRRELALAETVASLPDPVALRRSATLLQTVEQIDAALQRIAAGTYGRCVDCGREIPVERLEFRPHAAGCVDCQQPTR